MAKRKEVGKDQLNTEREGFNDRVERKKYLGSSKGVAWRKKRRHRSI